MQPSEALNFLEPAAEAQVKSAVSMPASLQARGSAVLDSERSTIAAERSDARATPYGFKVLKRPGRSLTKYVFIQDEPFFLPKLLDKYLREYAGTTAGINIQSIRQGNRTKVQTALALLDLYGPRYFQWKFRRYVMRRLSSRISSSLFPTKVSTSTIAAVAKKYGVPVNEAPDVNSEAFLRQMRDLGVELIVSISGTQLYRKVLREQTPFGIVNCHGGLLPRYRGLMPSFWTLANGESQGGVSVHFVDRKLDNGPIVVQKQYTIHRRDTLEDIMARSKDLAAEAILETVRLIEAGDPPLFDNPESEMTHFSMPTRQDVRRFLAIGHRFF